MIIKKYYIFRTVVIAILFSSLVSCLPKADPIVSESELVSHVNYLASEELGGRFPGTAGDSMAATYIRDQFEKYGLTLPGDNGYQTFDVITEVDLGTNNSFGWNRRMGTVQEDFLPLSFTGNGSVRSDLVFVGYGISIDKSTFTFNDYSDLDVTGKIVLILEGAPHVDDGEDDPFSGFLSQRSKILNAKDRGAIGVIFVSGPLFDKKDALKFVKRKESSVGLPVVRVKRTLADELLMQAEKSIADLEIKHSKGETGGFLVAETVFFQTDVVSKEAKTQNVMGFIESPNNPDGDILVIGAHYDHLGMGGPGSGSRVPDTTAIHYGADDNASGVAAVIELAGSLEAKKDQLPFSILFIAFACEEMGLIGSKYYVENPVYPLSRVNAMINIDMLGRLRDKKISVGGVGTAIEFADLVKVANTDSLKLAISLEGQGPSDHAAFYGKDLSVLYFSTGAHMDYHTPDDSIDKINGAGMVEVVAYIDEVIMRMGELSELTYQEAGPKQKKSTRSPYKVTLGIMPDFTDGGNDGLGVEMVTEGRPAQMAGMQKGDKIVSLNGLSVSSIQDYMMRLQTLEEGKTITVEVIRDGEKIVLLVQL
ncbi:MAG: M20/M25/M40 family metallo-hydrolase [Bacteroidales bacterium]|nr:M20/M25/M40 family metallo-hydrolase [Bacteroidales bacterium]